MANRRRQRYVALFLSTDHGYRTGVSVVIAISILLVAHGALPIDWLSDRVGISTAVAQDWSDEDEPYNGDDIDESSDGEESWLTEDDDVAHETSEVYENLDDEADQEGPEPSVVTEDDDPVGPAPEPVEDENPKEPIESD